MIRIEFTIKPKVILLEMTLPDPTKYYLGKAGQCLMIRGPHSSDIEYVICDQLDYKYNDGIILPKNVDVEIADGKLTIFEKDVPNFAILGGKS